jgi:uncharacterized protein (DUF1330 family)
VPAYVLVDIEITDPETYKEYVGQVQPSIDAYGGRFLVRGGTAENVEGDWQPGRIVVLEFDSLQRAKEWWASKAYSGPKALRQRSSVTRMIVVEGIPR